MFVIVDNIRSAYNVGSIFRTCDCAGVEGVFLTGMSAFPPHQKVEKTSLGAEKTVPWAYFPSTEQLIADLRANQVDFDIVSTTWKFSTENFQHHAIIALESQVQAKPFYETQLPKEVILVVGHEVGGISATILAMMDEVRELPLLGTKDSLNVASCFAVAAYEYLRQNTVSY